MTSLSKNLTEACSRLEIIKSVVINCVNVNDEISQACREGSLDKVKMLVSKEANINVGIFGACIKGQLETVEYLISKGANVNIGMVGACSEGWLEIVKFLVFNGADVNNGMHDACANGHLEVVKFLVSKGASNINGMHDACDNGHLEVVKILLTLGADVNLYLKTFRKWRNVKCNNSILFLLLTEGKGNIDLIHWELSSDDIVFLYKKGFTQFGKYNYRVLGIAKELASAKSLIDLCVIPNLSELIMGF